MEYLAAEEIVAIHFQVIQEYGGAFEVLSPERVKSCAEIARQTVFDQELYPDLASKAAVMDLISK